MNTESSLTFDIDLNQENANRALRIIQRHLSDSGFTLQSSNIDEDWASVSYKSTRSLGDVRNIQTHLLNQMQSSHIRISSDLLTHTPMLTVSLPDFEKFHSKIYPLGPVTNNNDVIEISFETSFLRDSALGTLQELGINAETYFNEKNLESRNNFTHKKNSLGR